MKRLLYLCMALGLLLPSVSCADSNTKQGNMEGNDTFASDPDSDFSGFSTFVGTVSDMDLWLQTTPSELKTAALQRLVDAYNSAVVMNSLITDFDLQICQDFMHDAAVKAIKDINLTVVKDPETLSKLQAYRKEMLYLLSVNPDSVDQEVHNPFKAKDDLAAYLSKKYNIKTFGRFDEKKVTADFYNCPGVPEWGKLIEQRGKKNLSQELNAKYKKAKDFDARCIYSIELAHAYEADEETWLDTGLNPAVPIMESLMKTGKYSPYLFTLWKTWRVLNQNSRGFSIDADIRNDIYNNYRKICARSIFSYIELHPEDLMAVNEFLLFAYEKNVLRLGEYNYGNQNAVDDYDLFPEKYTGY